MKEDCAGDASALVVTESDKSVAVGDHLIMDLCKEIIGLRRHSMPLARQAVEVIVQLQAFPVGVEGYLDAELLGFENVSAGAAFEPGENGFGFGIQWQDMPPKVLSGRGRVEIGRASA